MRRLWGLMAMYLDIRHSQRNLEDCNTDARSLGFDQTRYQDPSVDQYAQQQFSSQQADKFAQLNQQSFASNNAVAPYMPAVPTVLSCHPTSGGFGTKVFLKVSSQYDLFSMSSPMPYFFLQFGSERCPMQDVSRDNQDNTGFVYSCSADAPQLLVTGCNTSNVPMSLVIDGPSGEEISRAVAGTFQYLESAADIITRQGKMPKNDAGATATPVDQPGPSPKSGEPQLGPETSTNNYEYPSQQGQYAATFAHNNGDMITTYRSSSFADPSYGQRRSIPGWNGFGTPLGSTGRSPVGLDGVVGRPSLTPLPMPSSGSSSVPSLVRTSTITNGAGNNGPYQPINMYSTKAVLKINGKLDSMVEGWTQEEWDTKRRIVVFRKSQSGSTLTANFRAVPLSERPPNSICVSCIYWAEKRECFVTSVDTIQLLEQLVASPSRFSVEEKNRIRRNLEGFHPLTVSKAKADSEEFFKLIMGFPNPKPRNIEKDVKVFPWKILESALKKIIGKYSASPSSTLPPANMAHSVSSGHYAPLPTPPAHSMVSQPNMGSQHGDPHSQYSIGSGHHDAIPSPRSLSGSQQNWTPYTTAAYPTATRTMSPNIRGQSPHQPPPMRINTNPLPAVTTYDNRNVSTGSYGTSGLHTPISHHPSTATPPRWDTAPSSYAESYPGMTSQHGHGAPPMYTGPAYGDGAPRA